MIETIFPASLGARLFKPNAASKEVANLFGCLGMACSFGLLSQGTAQFIERFTQTHERIFQADG